MTWNYRIVKREVENAGIKDTIYNIVEAYYDSNGKIWGITDNCYPQGTTEEEFKEDLVNYIRAILKPVIDYDSIPEQGAINPMDEIGEVFNLEELAKELRKEC